MIRQANSDKLSYLLLGPNDSSKPLERIPTSIDNASEPAMFVALSNEGKYLALLSQTERQQVKIDIEDLDTGTSRLTYKWSRGHWTGARYERCGVEHLRGDGL
jgi:hypothetical protein